MLDVYLPVHETVKSSHWVGAEKLTAKAPTEETKEAIYVQERRRDDDRMVVQAQGSRARHPE